MTLVFKTSLHSFDFEIGIKHDVLHYWSYSHCKSYHDPRQFFKPAPDKFVIAWTSLWMHWEKMAGFISSSCAQIVFECGII